LSEKYFAGAFLKKKRKRLFGMDYAESPYESRF